MQLNQEHIAEQLSDDGAAQLITAGSASFDKVPPPWRPIAENDSAAERIHAALALWNNDFLALVPRFADALRTKLVDVRVYSVTVGESDFVVLVYVLEDAAGEPAAWIGCDPATFGDAEPLFWDSFPAAVQTFLRQVHPGFTATDWESFGIMRPEYFETIAERADCPEGIPGWMDGYEDDSALDYDGEPYKRIDSTRLGVFAKDEGHLFYCASPDLEVGQVTLVYDGDTDPPKDFGAELDELMTRRLANQ